jgi:hypothetical protein
MKQDEVEKNLEIFFIEHNIPYHKNVCLFDKNNKKKTVISEFDFILPNGIVECKTKIKIPGYKDIEKQLGFQIEFASSKQFFLFVKKLQPETLEFYKEKFASDPKLSKVIITDDPYDIIKDQIKFQEIFL